MREQRPFITLVLPAPATMAGAPPAGPSPGPAGPNLTDLGSYLDKPWRTDRRKWTYQPCSEMRLPRPPWLSLVHLTS
ncbi:hypothetical protein F511_05677 [Dorcoceras hygrometricum]|uniref:Uncharacterized protein n=1 Tax=Dorcoceras hygrometricum TaxID=472368 RepID=A0A2Z7C6Y7_9LAMI|nr:hypothetical protein F511_05677 [Dorcoceras hygrometricum]